MYNYTVGRTNIHLDEDLVAKAKRLYGLATKREVVHLALRRLVAAMSRDEVVEMEGSGWSGDLVRLRDGEIQDH